MDLWEFEASLVYRGSSRTARTVTQRNPVSKSKTKPKTMWKHSKMESAAMPVREGFAPSGKIFKQPGMGY